MKKAMLIVAAMLLAITTVFASSGQADLRRDQPAPEASRAAEAEPRLGAGELIVFERTVAEVEEDRDLYTVGAGGGEATLLTSPGSYPHWSPDGRQLAFGACMNPPDCTTALTLMERATGHIRWFLSPDPELWLGCTIWAPSGNRVACVGFGEVPPRPERNGIYSIRVSDGKGLTRITKNPGGEDGPLAYSPDGRQLLFNRLDPSRPESANQALFVTSVTGGHPQRITPWGFSDDWADWSPDGRTIVFGTNGFLYRVSPNGNGLAKIQLQTADPLSARSGFFDVSFSPDGSSIVFSVFRPPGIYTAHPDGSDVQRLTNSPTEDHHADWGAAPGI
jgi:Tol biopolymer transport system component